MLGYGNASGREDDACLARNLANAFARGIEEHNWVLGNSAELERLFRSQYDLGHERSSVILIIGEMNGRFN